MKFLLNSEQNDNRPIFITGNFNQWNPHDQNYQLKKEKEGYSIFIANDQLPSSIEYKYTKGGWEHVELDEKGNITKNRRINKSEKAAYDVVERWRKDWAPFKKEFFPIVSVVSENFYIPQLDKYRKVWILLPCNYHETKKDYPVLYLHDAQNLFNEGSKFGNWEIDKKLSVLAEYGRGDMIVVAVDHGNEDRIREYTLGNKKGPANKKTEVEKAIKLTSGSEGKRYIRFITDTLKPYIDAHYRTRKERKFTGIGGSSLGGLISIYAGFLYPEVYSKLLIFSPSLWVEPNNNFPFMKFSRPYPIKVYLYGGKKEGDKMVERIYGFEQKLKQWEKLNLFEFEIKTSINPEGIHQEFYWSQEFPKAVEWLYYDNPENPAEVKPKLEKRENSKLI